MLNDLKTFLQRYFCTSVKVRVRKYFFFYNYINKINKIIEYIVKTNN
jgi:hypothetical protein